MALRAVGLCNNLIKPLQNLSINNRKILPICAAQSKLLSPQSNLVEQSRNTNFFNKFPADHLWKSVTSVSNAGAKKGRGRGAGRKIIKDLNKGQVIGVGKINMVWPGLNAPVLRGKELVQRQELAEDPERMEKIYKIRDSQKAFRFLKLAPLERGWSGNKMPGRDIGPPDPIGDDNFEGFRSIVLMFKPLIIMKGNLGRYRRMHAMVVTGNGNGLVGFGFGKAKDGKAALRRAKNRAGQRLMHFDLYNNHTVYHDFIGRFHNTRVYVYKQAEGYGLKAHRAIREICKCLGIKDIGCKREGGESLPNLVKAFFLGLMQQKSHQNMANEKKLHLVEFRKENEYFPRVVASPDVVRTKEEIQNNEVLDFTRYCLNNKVILNKQKRSPFYTRMRHWVLYLKRIEKTRNHDKIKEDMMVQYGKLDSFILHKFPEAKKDEESTSS